MLPPDRQERLATLNEILRRNRTIIERLDEIICQLQDTMNTMDETVAPTSSDNGPPG